MVVPGWAAFQSPQVLVRTEIISNVNSASWSGPDSATPENVSNTDWVWNSYITLFDRDSRPDVRSSSVSKPSGTSSVRYAWAEPHNVQ